MNLEAVQHLSGVPRYAISLLGMIQMWLLLQSQMFPGHICRGLHSSQKSLHSHTPHIAQRRKSPATTLVAFRNGPIPSLSILLTHLSRDEKNQGQNRKKKKISMKSYLHPGSPKVHWECSTFWYLFYCSVKFLRFLRFLLSLAETGVSAEDVQKPAYQNN